MFICRQKCVLFTLLYTLKILLFCLSIFFAILIFCLCAPICRSIIHKCLCRQTWNCSHREILIGKGGRRVCVNIIKEFVLKQCSKFYTSGGNVARWNRTARLKCEKIVLWHWIAGSNREERFRERDLDREQERETDTETERDRDRKRESWQ